jgi:hypothetical protein
MDSYRVCLDRYSQKDQMIVWNIGYYRTSKNDQEVTDTIMNIIDKKIDSSFLRRIKYAFSTEGLIEGNNEGEKLFFYRSASMGFDTDIFYVEYYFKTMKINDHHLLKITSQLNPIGLMFTAIVWSPLVFGILDELVIVNSGFNLLGGLLISLCFYGVVFIAYKMNRDSTLENIEELLELKRVELISGQ